MMTLADRALGPTSTIEENLTYLTSVKYLQTLRGAENIDTLVEQLMFKVTSSAKRLEGLHFLEFVLKENEDIYGKARWMTVLHDVLKDPVACDLKGIVCKILTIVIGILKKDPKGYSEDIKTFVSSICPLLLSSAEKDIEWKEPAICCLVAAIKDFPNAFVIHKELLTRLVIEKLNCVSSKHFEVYADLFAYLPLIQPTIQPDFFQESWTTQYLYALNTMNFILNHLLSFIPIEDKFEVEEANTFIPLYESPIDVFFARSNQIREFINLCRCISKMLSTKSKYPVQIPHERTLECIKRLFPVDVFGNLNRSSTENQIIMCHIYQLQIACFTIMEPLLTNFNTVAYNAFICSIIRSGLNTSPQGVNNSIHSISQHRHVLWKITRIWLSSKGAMAAMWIVRYPTIIQELLADVLVQTKYSQVSDAQITGKSKKTSVKGKEPYKNPNWVFLCKEALKALTAILYKGSNFMKREVFDTILKCIIPIAYGIHPAEDFPFPYTDEKCRKNLYEVLAALVIVSKYIDTEILHSCITIFNNGLQDPNHKVNSVCIKASAICHLIIHPKKPSPSLRIQNQPEDTEKVSDSTARYRELVRDEPCVENIPPAPSVDETVPLSYHQNDTEMLSDDFPRIESHYSEASESQCNGDDILEIQIPSHNLPDVEDSEEEEDDEEDEEEEDEEEEEMVHDVEVPPDHMYIPSSSNELQVMTPVHSNQEEAVPSSDEIQLEELRPASNKVMTNLVTVNDMQHNGMHDDVPEEVQSESAVTQNTTNENGLLGELSDEEEMEEGETKDEEEEAWSEEVINFPAEKRVPDFGDSLAKKPKVEDRLEEEQDESQCDEREEERADSPTMEEMKASLVLSDAEEAPLQTSQ